MITYGDDNFEVFYMMRKHLLCIGILIGLLALCHTGMATGEYAFIESFGEAGSGDGQFQNPHGIAIDLYGNVYVADTYNHRISVFDRYGSFMRTWGSIGTDAGALQYPKGLAVDASGLVYVADTNNHRVQVFDSYGDLRLSFGSYGSGNGQFSGPSDIATDAHHIYVADTGNNRIQKFNKITGAYVTQWGEPGTGDGMFWQPSGIALNDTGYVYVMDEMNRRIQFFDNAGFYTGKWTSFGNGIDIDESGNLFVTDTINHQVLKRTGSGNYLSDFGSAGSGDGELNNPRGIAIKRPGAAGLTPFVYVADTDNNRISIWAPTGSVLSPKADFIATPLTGTAPLTVQFTDTSSNIPTSWLWNFGDGSTSVEQNPSYRYQNPGTYSVTLRVENREGISTKTMQNYITVVPTPVGPYLEFIPYDDMNIPYPEDKRYDPISLSPGQTKKYALWLRYPGVHPSKDLAGYNITLKLELSQPGVGTIIDVEFPEWAQFNDVSPLPDTQVRCTATDLTGSSGTTNIRLLDLIVRADTVGDITLNIAGGTHAIQDREGKFYQPYVTADIRPSLIEISGVLPFPRPSGGLFPMPQQMGLITGAYEDLDGNWIKDTPAWVGFNDVVVYYANMQEIRDGRHGRISYYDYDNNGWIGFNDIVTLYNLIT